jgi:putative protease
MKETKPLPELLAPAGSMEAGLSALDAGADAVYAGLPGFNARERGQNFTMEALSKLTAWAHKLDRKVYVTLNTLIKESELPEVTALLAGLDVFRPDAVIVQDLGLVRMIREGFPELEIHASTQMGIHNSAGAHVAQKMGISRVILERQVTYEEIAEIRRRSAMELEVFIHGALCCSRSGACLFSSWMGGWSGNRGKCKQPCRRRYHTDQGNGFFFSPRDLYSLDAVPHLVRMGISALKIEGRLRRADYVSRVVSAYRMMLDDPDGDLKEARAVLSGALGRKWQPAFRRAADFKDVIQHTAIGASGLLCGKVVQATDKGFMAQLSRPLALGDTIRVQPPSGDEGPAITVTRMSVRRKPVQRAGKGQACWIHYDKAVAKEAWVYKTGVEPPDMAKRIAGLPEARPVLDLAVTFRGGRLSVRCRGRTFECPAELEAAKSRPLAAAAVREAFRKTASSRFAAGRIQVDLPDGCFLPLSRLKELKRRFWAWADATIEDPAETSPYTPEAGPVSDAPCVTTVRVPGNSSNPRKGALTARSIEAFSRGTDEVVLPEFCPEFELAGLKKNVARAIERGARRFRVTSLYGFDLLEGLDVTASFPLPACNSLAAWELSSLGAARATAWVELDKAALEELLDRCRGFFEVFARGRIPVLSTRLDIPAEGEITDGRGARFQLIRSEGLAWLYPEKVLSIPVPPGVSTYIDLTHAGLDEAATDGLNYLREFL